MQNAGYDAITRQFRRNVKWSTRAQKKKSSRVTGSHWQKAPDDSSSLACSWKAWHASRDNENTLFTGADRRAVPLTGGGLAASSGTFLEAGPRRNISRSWSTAASRFSSPSMTLRERSSSSSVIWNALRCSITLRPFSTSSSTGSDNGNLVAPPLSVAPLGRGDGPAGVG